MIMMSPRIFASDGRFTHRAGAEGNTYFARGSFLCTEDPTTTAFPRLFTIGHRTGL